MFEDQLPYEVHPSPGRRRRAGRSRTRGLILPLFFAVVAAMIGIPLLSFQLCGDLPIGYASGPDIRLAELDDLPRQHQLRAKDDLAALKDWVKEHFTDEEIEEIRDRFVAGRDPHVVQEELDRLADAAARGSYVDIPRYFTDQLRGRLGNESTHSLKLRIERMEPRSEELKRLAIEEVYPGDEMR